MTARAEAPCARPLFSLALALSLSCCLSRPRKLGVRAPPPPLLRLIIKRTGAAGIASLSLSSCRQRPICGPAVWVVYFFFVGWLVLINFARGNWWFFFLQRGWGWIGVAWLEVGVSCVCVCGGGGLFWCCGNWGFEIRVMYFCGNLFAVLWYASQIRFGLLVIVAVVTNAF